MALEFEDSWAVKGTTYVREHNTTTNKSEVRVSPHKSEYYLEDPLGSYKSFLEPDVKLRKATGSAYNVDNAYGVKSGVYTTIREDYFYTKENYNRNVNVWYLDIETKVGYNSIGFPNAEDAAEEICLMQFYDKKTQKGYVLGLEEWYYQKDYSYDFNMEYIKYDSEKEMLNGYLRLFKEMDPYIIYAWSGDGFDFPYIYNRLKKLGINTNKLSNHGNAKLKTKKLDNGVIQNDLEATGHWYSDMINSYKKFVSVFEPVASMSLDFVGERETGISKVDHLNYIKFDDFRIGKYKILGNETDEQKAKKIHKCAVALENNPDMPQAKRDALQKYIKEKSYSEFVHYGVQDFVILKGIDDARNLTGIMVQMAQMTASRLNDAHGTLKYWDACISATILKDKLVTPPKKDNDASNIVGGYVAQPHIGKHKWILSADINSMYPLLGIVGHNLSPETFIPISKRPQEVQDHINKHYYDQDEHRVLALPKEVTDESTRLMIKHDLVLGLNGSVYSRAKEGFLPKLVNGIYADRKVAKKTMFKYDQKAVNIETEMRRRGISLP